VKNAPQISVLMTVYNRAAYLADAVESVLGSSFQDWELIIVDDVSQDRSVEIARGYAQRDPRIRVFVNEQNLGDYPNRARAAELARGCFLKYLDSDDLIYRHSLAIMGEAMAAHPAAALGLCHAAPEEEQPYPWELSPVEAWRKQFLGRGCLDCGPSGAILRREAFFESGGFRDWGVLNDTDLWYRMAARWPVLLLPPGLVWWRRHPQQEFTRDHAALTYLDRGFALTTQTLSSAECPLPALERKAALQRARQHQARRLLSLMLKQRQVRCGWRLFRESGLSYLELANGFKSYELT
jgi:glycosyltransferase involved in cell wall biosynthesis